MWKHPWIGRMFLRAFQQITPNLRGAHKFPFRKCCMSPALCIFERYFTRGLSYFFGERENGMQFVDYYYYEYRSDKQGGRKKRITFQSCWNPALNIFFMGINIFTCTHFLGDALPAIDKKPCQNMPNQRNMNPQ